MKFKNRYLAIVIEVKIVITSWGTVLVIDWVKSQETGY